MSIRAEDLQKNLYVIVKKTNNDQIEKIVNVHTTQVGTKTVPKDLIVTGDTYVEGSSTGPMTAVPSIAGGRLTLTSGTPITSSDVTSAQHLYYTPYASGQITLWNGVTWKLVYFDELSLYAGNGSDLILTPSKNYDVFLYLNGNSPAMEFGPVWTDNNTRSVGLSYYQGVRVKSTDYTRRYVGTIRSTATVGLLEDSTSKRFVWNYDNRVMRSLKRVESTDSWSYSGITYRAANGSTSNSVEIVFGDTSYVEADVQVLLFAASSGYGASVGVGIDTETTNSASVFGCYTTANTYSISSAIYRGYPSVGFHVLYWIEITGGIAITWYGDSGFPTFTQFGLSAQFLG